MAEEYLSFIVLLGGLFIISGGILLHGDLEATPATNTAFLGVGAVLASFIGTTGASMLVIRALLQTNRERQHVRRTVIFFIFLVSNIGGMLTPLGDPPLFLGYLQGVPFAWTFRLWPQWLFMTVVLLAVYFLWDTRAYARETAPALRRDRTQVEPLRAEGVLNALGLGLVVLAVAFLRAPWRELAIVEVAVLFFGIFLTMLPALDVLRARGAELGVRSPAHFFWASGDLSSFLDNAPTYLTFLALAQGLGLPGEVVGMPHAILAAISVGAVAMGANTYIGNAPNFMVKAIAEEAKVRMPSFFGYMVYSGAVLIPVFVVTTLLFFR